MRYKKRLSFRWLIIPLSLFVAIGFWITPALAQDVDSDGNPLSESAGDVYTLGATDMGVGTIIMENDEEFLAPPDREATADGAFGGKTQAIWINSFAFEPRFSSTGYGLTGIAHRYGNSGDGVFVAPLNLPSGVRLTTVRFYIYDNTSYSIGVFLYRGGTSQTAYSTLINAEASGGSSGYKAVQYNLNHTVYNGNYQYTLGINLPTAAASGAMLWGARCTFYRQIIYPASQIFNDVPPSGTWAWAYPSVQALSASGITQGCPDGPNLFCPSKPVSRAAMATFLARALGLHADFNAWGF